MVTTLNPDSAKVGSQVGRSVPRLEGRDKVTGRAEYTHTMRVPGMLHAKLFRSTRRPRQDQVDRHQRGEEAAGRAARRHRRRRDEGAGQPLLRPGLPRPADPGAREGALRRRAGRRRDRHRSAHRRAGGAAHHRRIRGAAGGLRRGRCADLEGLRARPAQARRHLRRPQASEGRQEHQPRARLSAAPRRFRQGLCRRRAQVRARVQDAEGAAPVVRAVRLHRRLQGHPRHLLRLLAGAVVRAHRDRAAARLAGEQGARSRCRISARATAPSSTSSSRRWRSRSP